MKHLLKDLRIALDAAAEMAIDLPGTALAEQLFAKLNKTHGDEVYKPLSNYGQHLRQRNSMFHVKRRLESNSESNFDCKGDNIWQLKGT